MPSNPIPDHSWKKLLEKEVQEPYFKNLMLKLETDRNSGIDVYPPQELIFEAFRKTPFDKVKAVIIGQDPYHGPNQATGLSFSVPEGFTLPPSLKNIFKELESDLGVDHRASGDLSHWAEQGVFLLNLNLTVCKGKPLSHHGIGWEKFTDKVVSLLCKKKEPLVFMLWGKVAQDKVTTIQGLSKELPHLLLLAPHPSPFSARTGFFGCRHFSKTNDFLNKNDINVINWCL